MKSRLFKLTGLLAVTLMIILLGTSVGYADAPVATYEVTITNLVTEGQPLTPPLVAVHRASTDIFTVGEAASFGLKEVAENGNLDPLHEMLSGDKHVADVAIAASGDPPPLLPQEAVTFMIAGSKGAKYLSYVSMLICTNDGFTGVDSVRLPKKVGDRVTVLTNGYDAGTEINTEDFADMVPPCQALVGVSSDDVGSGMSDPALAENGVIRHHPGIQGGEDLIPAIHGWTDPVSEVVITRIE